MGRRETREPARTDAADEATCATWQQAERAVNAAFEMRVALWDAVRMRIGSEA